MKVFLYTREPEPSWDGPDAMPATVQVARLMAWADSQESLARHTSFHLDDRRDYATAPMSCRPSGVELFKRVEQYDVVVLTTAGVGFYTVEDLLDTLTTWHNRRAFVAVLDAMPLPQQDSATQLIYWTDYTEALRRRTLSHRCLVLKGQGRPSRGQVPYGYRKFGRLLYPDQELRALGRFVVDAKLRLSLSWSQILRYLQAQKTTRRLGKRLLGGWTIKGIRVAFKRELELQAQERQQVTEPNGGSLPPKGPGCPGFSLDGPPPS